MKYIRGKLLSKQEEGSQCIIRMEGDLSFLLIPSLQLRHKQVGDVISVYTYEDSNALNGKMYPVAEIVKPRKTILSVISQNMRTSIDEVEAMWEEEMSYDSIVNQLYINNQNKKK